MLTPANLLLILLISSTVLLIIYIIVMRSTLEAVQESNRTTSINSVWLLFIPIFNIIWKFILVKKLSESINNGAKSKGITLDSPEPGKSLGTIACAAPFVPLLNLIQPILSIVYLVKLNNYKKLIS